LSGSVPSAYHRDRLVEQVEKVRGVTRVTAKLDIRPESRTDAEIERDAQAALAYDSDTREIAVDVEARDGVVTLRGSVKTGGQRAAVEDVVKTVPGVHEIENTLELAAAGGEDHAMERDVQVELAGGVVVEDPIEVLVEHGEVMLGGTVDSHFEPSWAVRRAWSVNGLR